MAVRKRCPVCGSADVRVESPSRYEYGYCGLSGVVLEGDAVALTECDKCGESTSTIHNEVQLLQVIGLTVVLAGPGLTGEELAYLRSLFEFSQEDLSRAIGRSRRETIADWEAHGTERIFRAPFDELNLRVVLMALFRSKVIESKWCCLSAQHLEQFSKATATIIARVDELLTASPGHGPLNVRRTASTGEWKPRSLIAA